MTDADKILCERYQQIRDEIIHRIEARYKLIQFVLAFAAGLGGVIAATQIMELGAVGCAVIMTCGILFAADSSTIWGLADYLVAIEKHLDKSHAIPIPGWERWSRQNAVRKSGATSLMLISVIGIYACIYIGFAFVLHLGIEASALRTIVWIVLPIPPLLLVSYCVWAYQRYWIDS